jgi:hypothetical protein
LSIEFYTCYASLDLEILRQLYTKFHKHLINGRSCDDKAHGELFQNFEVQKSITGVNLNGLGYTTNVHIFILGSCNVHSCYACLYLEI